MKTSQLSFVIAALLFGYSSAVAQADCGYSIFVSVLDENNQSVKNPRLSLNGWKVFAFLPDSGEYRADGLLGVGARESKERLKVSAKGFKMFEQDLSIACSKYEFRLIMRPKNSKQASELIRL